MEKLLNYLRYFHRRCVRAICRVNRRHTRLLRISTRQLLLRTKLSSLDCYITKRQLRWAGHVWRMGPERLPRKMLTSWVHAKRPRGCPQMTYGRSFYKALQKVNIERTLWTEKARDHAGWRTTLRTLTLILLCFSAAIFYSFIIYLWAYTLCKG